MMTASARTSAPPPPRASSSSSSSSALARCARIRGGRVARRAVVAVRAGSESDKLSRNVIDLDKRKIGPGVGKPVKVTFVGAGGQEVTVDCPEDQYILDAGIDAGLELPFTCRGGICGACVAKCVEGSVDHRDIADLEFTLDEEEQAEGMALICMAYPVGDIKLETQSDWGLSLGREDAGGGWKGATGEIGGRDPTPLMGETDRKGL